MMFTLRKMYILFFYSLLDDADPVLTPKVEKLSDSYTRLEQLVNILFT